RLGLVAKTQEASPEPARSRSAADGESELSQRVKAFFTFGRGYCWGMTASAQALLRTAFVAAIAVWLLSKAAFGLPIWFAALASAAAAFFGPRTLLRRQEERAKRDFTNLFPDAVDT